MRYKNMRTGAVIETECVCKGTDWCEMEPVRPPVLEKPARKKRAVKKDGQLRNA